MSVIEKYAQKKLRGMYEMKCHLYKVISNPPSNFAPRTAQQDILSYWPPGMRYLFSVSQIANRTGLKRGAVKRQVIQLIKLGVVEIYS